MDRILVVEDDEAARLAMADLLRSQGFVVDTAVDGTDAIAQVEKDPPALIISDVCMPDASGLEMVQRLRKSPASTHIPVILVSALAERERRLAGLTQGADDFLAKPVDADELIARINVQLRNVHWQHELERRSLLDPLTGVLNRRGLTGELRREVERAARDGAPLSVLMVDVNRFKALNDAYGHQIGDTALRHLARGLTSMVRAVDRVGRFGGDEFVVILPGASAEGAAQLAARMRALRLPVIAVAAGQDVRITISVGAATLTPGENADQLLDRADRSMYANKRS